MFTLAQLTEATYQCLGVPSDVSNFNTTVVFSKINDVIKRICRGKVISLIDERPIAGGDLPFLRKNKFYSLIKPKTLTVDLITSATYAYMDVTDLPGTGAFMVDQEVIEYSSVGVDYVIMTTSPQVKHLSGATVYILYSIPTDSSKPFTIYQVRQGLTSSKVEIPMLDDRYPLTAYSYARIVIAPDGTQRFSFEGFNGTSDVMQVVYYKSVTDLVNTTDVCVIDYDSAQDMIANIAAGEIWHKNEEPTNAATKLKAGYLLLQEMYDFYSKPNKRNREVIKPSPMDFSSIRGYGKRGYTGGY